MTRSKHGNVLGAVGPRWPRLAVLVLLAAAPGCLESEPQQGVPDDPSPEAAISSQQSAVVANGSAINWAYYGTATASSTLSSTYAASRVNDSTRSAPGYTPWHAAVAASSFTCYNNSQWVQINLNTTRMIGEVDVFSVQDNYASPIAPYMGQTKSRYGLLHFHVQYWTGWSWVDVPNGYVTWNNKVWAKVTFPQVSTQYLRVTLECGDDAWGRIAEIEAYGGNGTWGSPPSCSQCDGSSSCSPDARCVDDNGMITTCKNFGVCDTSGTCATSCTQALRSCGFNCTSGGLATNCGNMGYACSDAATVTYTSTYDPPPQCSSCNFRNACSARCLDGATMKTCSTYIQSYPNVSFPAGTTVTGQFQCDTGAIRPTRIKFYVKRTAPAQDYSVEVMKKTLRGFLNDGSVEAALQAFGLPTSGEIIENADTIYQNFEKGRVYFHHAGNPMDESYGVSGIIWTNYNILGAHLGALGKPISSPSSTTSYPRSQKFEGIPNDGLSWTITASSAGSATVAGPQCSETLCKASFTQHIVTAQQATQACQLPNAAMTTCEAWGASQGDADLDDIPDALEAQLADRFAPSMRIMYTTFGFLNDAPQAYGHPNRVYGGAFAPYVVRLRDSTVNSAYGSTTGFDCLARRCIEIIYLRPYNWDGGDPELPTAIGSHRGDTEFVAVLVAREDPYTYNGNVPRRWGSSWAEASADVTRWRLMKRFLTAHHLNDKNPLGPPIEWTSSTFENINGQTGLDPALFPDQHLEVFVALNKHANYPSAAACDSGAHDFDNCDGVPAGVLYAHRNAGEIYAHNPQFFPGAIIENAGVNSWDVAGSSTPSTYAIWSGVGAEFGSYGSYALTPKTLQWSQNSWWDPRTTTVPRDYFDGTYP